MARKFEEFFNAKQEGPKGNELRLVMEQRFEENAIIQQQMMHVVGGLYEALKEAYAHITESNAYIKRVEGQVLTMRSDITSIVEKASDILSLTQESREKHYIGKETEVLEMANDKAKSVTFKEVRTMVSSATRRQPEGYRELFGKIYAITGYAVWEDEKLSIKKSDGLIDSNGKHANGSTTWINTLFLKGYKETVYLVAKEMLTA